MCITDTPYKPFNKLSIYTIGPLSITENKNKYALTVICNLTKYLIVVPVKNKESITIAKALVENVFLNYGLCQSILSDMGTEYVNKLFQEVTKILQIEHQRATPYHPQTMGGIERSHRTLNEYLRSYLIEDNHEWDILIKYFAYSYNTTPHSSFEFQFSPFELLFGRVPNTLEILQKNQAEPCYNIDDYAKEVKYKMQVAYSLARKLLIQSKELNKKIYDKNLNNVQFKLLNKILIVDEKHKMNPIYESPYTIKEIDNNNVTIQHDITNKQKIVHKNRIIKYFK